MTNETQGTVVNLLDALMDLRQAKRTNETLGVIEPIRQQVRADAQKARTRIMLFAIRFSPELKRERRNAHRRAMDQVRRDCGLIAGRDSSGRRIWE